MTDEKEKSFEEELKRLEEIVRSLEKGDAPLAESLGLFEEGTALVKRCGSLLEEAEQRVTAVRKTEDGSPAEVPFE